jgi:hypothetical protein
LAASDEGKFVNRFVRRVAPAALGLLLVSLPRFAPPARAQIPPSRDWSQPHGNSAGTACIDVAPLKGPPAELWRFKSGGILAGPVLTQSKLFVVVKDGDAKLLVALDPASGATLAKQTLDKVGDVSSMAAGDGLVCLVEPAAVHLWRMAGSELRFEKTFAGSFAGELALTGTSFLVGRGGGGVVCVEAAMKAPAQLIAKSFGRPGALMDDSFGANRGRSIVATTSDDANEKLAFNRYPVLPGAGAATGSIKVGPAETLCATALGVPADNQPKSVLVAVQGKEGNEWCAWFGNSSGGGLLRKTSVKFTEFRTPPAACNGRLYGFTPDATLVEVDVLNGGTNRLVDKEDLPKGAQIGAPSIARDALFLGNWAVEFGTHKVLWCLDKLEADGPAVPIGDELLAIRTKDGALVGLGSTAAAKAAKGAAGGGAKSGAAAYVPKGPPDTLPGAQPGLVRSDGLFIPGKATALDGGRWKIEPDGGKPFELDANDVAMVNVDGKTKRVGDEGPVYRACWSVLAYRHATSLVEVIEKYRDAKLFDDCNRLLEEAKADGLPAAKYDELQSAVAGKTAVKLAPSAPLRKKAEALEADTRESSAAAIVSAAKWCAAKECKTAATVLATRAAELAPKSPPDPELVKSWQPEGFPTDAEHAGGKTWPQWAEALLPSGGFFPVLDESAKRRMSVSKFAQGALVISTRNITLYTKEYDLAVVGPMLSRGEATVRALQKLLGPSPMGMRADTMLEVHLHKTKADYLADMIVGSTPPPWSAGCFSPGDGISRFYSTESKNEGASEKHTLHEVFAHELTHHFTDRRWMHDMKTKGASNGFWLVEGFAEFVAGQALEFGRFGESFDDETVRSIDEAAAVARAEKLFPLEFLMGLDQARFQTELEGGFYGPYKLHHSLKDTMLDKRYLFYCQSTALTFFVINRCGEKGLATYVSWLKKQYSGQGLEAPWKDLGFADMAAFEKAFRTFMLGV